jgi:hypothetical protein
VLVCVLLGSRRRRRRPRAAREETNGKVRSRSGRGREACRERVERERLGFGRNLLRLPPAPARFLGLCCPGMAMASSAKLREERKWSEGANGQQGSAQGVCGGFICGGGLGAGCTSTVAIGRGWRCFWYGVVSRVDGRGRCGWG